MEHQQDFALSCPTPLERYPNVTMAHGGGGKLMHRLIEQVFLDAFDNPALNARHDSAVVNLAGTRLAVTTDSYVVQPLFFPGGDIGSLAVYGTINDLAMSGARPAGLSAGFILEEGLPIETLRRVAASMSDAARRVGVPIVTGDTKVVDKGKGDGIFINTAGFGVVEHGIEIAPQRVRPGDVVLVNGDLGRHGIAIMALREGLAFENEVVSDLAPLASLVLDLIEAGVEVHCLRDLTRGGLGALNEIAHAAGVQIGIEEACIPVHEDVRGACELLGLDPIYVANEGRLAAFVAPGHADRAIEIMRADPDGREAVVIGRVTEAAPGRVTMKGAIGVTRIVDMPITEPMPRIC